MTKDQALWMLHGVYWAHGEGQATDEMFEAALSLIAQFEITQEDCRAFDKANDIWTTESAWKEVHGV